MEIYTGACKPTLCYGQPYIVVEKIKHLTKRLTNYKTTELDCAQIEEQYYHPESTGYSALPSPPTLMPRAVAAWRTHRQTYIRLSEFRRLLKTFLFG